jgi:predicted ArsR family transcriptional regulator
VLKGWVEEIESEVLEYLRGRQPTSLQDLASALRISEALALSYVTILAREGKVTIGGLGVRDNYPIC